MKRKMAFIQKIGFLGLLILLTISTMALISSKDKLDTPSATGGNKNIVVLELFTSQGCSSCPPADALLAEYAKSHNENIIPLSFHVDYWNRLGWTDPFSSKAYSNRQEWYSQHFPKGSIYTPQMIVNGKGETVGNNRGAVNNLVQKELAGSTNESIAVTNVELDKANVKFHYTSVNTNTDEVVNAALIQKQATTPVRAGENNGVTISNHNIVRTFTTQPVQPEAAAQIALPANFKTGEYALVLYVQNKKSLSITTAVMKDL